MGTAFCWRKTRPNDLPECLSFHPAKNGAEVLGYARALEAWTRLLAITHATRSSVIELDRNGKREIVGFGLGVFVKKSFADAELSHPAPGQNCRVLASVLGGGAVIATYEEVRAANTRGDVQQVVLDTSWKQEHLNAAEVETVRVLLAKSYQELYAGYRLSRVLSELVDERDFRHARDLRAFRIVDRFESYWKSNPDAGWNRERALIAMTVDTMRGDPGSVAAGLFQSYTDPRFEFTREEQELLEAALEGMDDASAAHELFVSQPAIKRRWQNIFHRVAAVMPELCPPDGEGTRGIQKRQRVLTYVRHNPGELRPFERRELRKTQ